MALSTDKDEVKRQGHDALIQRANGVQRELIDDSA